MISDRLEIAFDGLETFYTGVLTWTLGHRLATTGIAVTAIVVAVMAGRQLPGEFFLSNLSSIGLSRCEELHLLIPDQVIHS